MSTETVKAPGKGHPRPGARRRPLERARDWTRRQTTAARESLNQPHTKKRAVRVGAVFAVLAIAIAVLVAIWDWNWFRGPLARMMSARMHREVQITGDLDVHLWSWSPTATLEGLRIADPAWAGGGRMAQVDKITASVRILPLLRGRVDVPILRFDHPVVKLYADAQGRKTWTFTEGPAKPLKLPPIHNFIINNGKLDYRDDKRGLTFGGTINAAERINANNRGFELVGKGTINRAPFNMEVTGGPLLNIKRSQPYPFDADIRAGATHITAKGQVPKPFDLGVFYMAATASGPDMSQVYALTGIALPNTPPYNLRGRVSRDDQLWKIDDIGGKVGDSDLAGDMSVKLGGERPLLKANLRSRSLDFDDLGALFGGSPSTRPGETASADQKAVASQLAAQRRIFPDSTLATDRIRAIDADVTYKALSIRDTPVNLKSGSVRVRLDDGLLRADPLEFQLPQGKVTGKVELNARRATPVTDLDLRLTDARLEQLVPVTFGGAHPFTGTLVGRAKLRGTGNSVHKAFASADGEVMVVVPNGEIRKAFAELMGVNVVKGLGLLLSKNEETTPIRCGVAHFNARNGLMTADRLVFDTGPVVVDGKGTVNLNSERMDIRVQGHPKKFRLVRVMLPVTAKGPILGPKLGVEPGKAIAQGGIAAALGSALSPLAAILPFIDPGLAKDANCAAILTDARQDGAPVKQAAIAAAPAGKR